VGYGDVWRKRVEPTSPNDKAEHIVFVIDNMPEALDVKMPNLFDSKQEWIDKDVEIYKYIEENYVSFVSPWGSNSKVYAGGYKYEDTSGLVIPHKRHEYEWDGSKIYMFKMLKD